MKNHIQQGVWIIATNKVLSKYNLDQPVFDPFDATITAGRAGELFSAIRSLGLVKREKFDAYRKFYKLKPSVTKKILKIAEELESLDVSWSIDPESNQVEGVKFLNDSKDEVYKLTGKLFRKLHPTKIEASILDILSNTLLVPQTVREIKIKLIESGLSEKEAADTIKLATGLELISKTKETEKGQKILFNPHAFEKNATDAFDAINGLDYEKKQKAIDVLEFVKSNPGIPLKQSCDLEIVKLLIKIGLIDYSKITTLKSSTSRYFPTAPHIWGVFAKSSGNALSNDLIDDSKLLLNSFRYGQFFSTTGRGRIKEPSWIVNALIRDGAIGTVTPATAIGTDYPLALSRGIVNIVESRIYPGRYSMELMKFDVAEAVRDVLDQNTILPKQETPSAKDLERAGQFFTSPDAVRVETKLPNELKMCQEEIIFSLRTMRRDR
jgi:hypothetical protein